MKKYLLRALLLLLAFLPLVLVAFAQPTLMINPENMHQSAWFVYTPGMTEYNIEEQWLSVEELHGKPFANSAEAKFYAEYYKKLQFFQEHELQYLNGAWYLHHPGKSTEQFSWKKLHRVTPWFSD